MVRLKIKFLGKTDFLVLTHGKEYDVISIEKGWYRVFDDSGDDYLYPPKVFEITEELPKAPEFDYSPKGIADSRKA